MRIIRPATEPVNRARREGTARLRLTLSNMGRRTSGIALGPASGFMPHHRSGFAVATTLHPFDANLMDSPTFSLPASSPRRRPAELIYAADERVPRGALLVLGGQHAVTALAFVTYVLVTAKSAGLSLPDTQSMVAMSLLGMALCTGLQAWGGRWGSGALLAHMPNPFMVPFAATAVAIWCGNFVCNDSLRRRLGDA